MKQVIHLVAGFLKRTDWLLLLLCLSLSSVSTLLLVSLAQSGTLGEGALRTVVVQSAMMTCGVAAALILSRIDYREMARLWKVHSAIAYFLCVLCFTPLGVQRSDLIDDRAWLQVPLINFTFQPSELLKISFVLTFAYHLAKLRENQSLNRPKDLALLCLHGLLPVAVIHLQGDDGTALVLAVMFAFMLFAAGLSWKYILPVLAMVPPAAWVAWTFLLDSDKRSRVLAIFNPEVAGENVVWQQERGRIAIGSGGLWGKGIFMESGQFQLVPEVHNDFIFSFIGEAVGFIGCMAVLGVLLFICLRILWDGLHASDDLGRFVCVGIFAMLAAQIVINVGMCLSLFPVVGVTLPFLSAGGTSQGTLYLGIGLVLSVTSASQRNLFFD